MKTKLIFATVVALAALAVFTLTVLGHASLVSSDPADGATITTPYTLTANFDEELTATGSSIAVQDSTGAQVAAGTVSEADDKSMTAELPQLPDGEYTVLWTAVTADDNAVERGTYQFNVGTAAASTGASPGAASPAVASPGASPVPSATSGQNTGSGNDLLLPLAIAVVIVAAIAAYFVYRNRR